MNGHTGDLFETPDSQQVRKRVMAIDHGEKRVGVAISDETRSIAVLNFLLTPLDLEGDCKPLRELIDEHGVSLIVFGMPLLMSGKMGEQAERVAQVKDHVAATIDTPVTTWDERLTTSSAKKILIKGGVRRKKRKSVIDKLAATLILQSYLDSVQPG